MSKIVIAAGGTGGHVFPGLAVAKALEKKQIKVIWFGTKSGLEHRVIPENGIIFYKFNIKGLRGKSKLIKLCNSIRLAWASLRSICLILWLRPRAVLIMGGYIGAAVG
ncbi:MAG: glycosyltransferase, partial [Gammaproteobacteria bacterium]|nr:glycosyltransferase [Gammaproteobacteria bacterium]